jgi:hypothetical protein
MSWPLSHDFNEAIQNPQLVFTDPDLKGAEAVVGARGLPLPRSGNFADVYQLRGTDGRDWAVKCFTRPVVGLAQRYARVSEALEHAKLPFVVGFSFLPEGMLVAGARRPVVKMEWVEGLLLNQVVRENAGRPAVLAALGQMWVRLCKRLREARITHADIQHGNVLLVPGARPGAYGLKLIDYDGMYVPALANQPSGEVGHSSYQHPTRATGRVYSPDVDRFPHLVVLTALKGLEASGPGLWERHDTGDNLLFTEEDFKKPAESKVMRELWRTEHPAVQALVGRLALACGRPIPQTPWVDEFAPDGEPTPLDNDSRRAAAAALGVALPVPVALPPEPTHHAALPAVVPLPPEPSAVPAVPVQEVDVELVEEQKAGGRAEKKAEKKRPAYRPPGKSEKSNSHMLLIVGGILLLVGGVAAAIALSGGKKPEDTTQNPNDGDPNGGGTVPKDKEPVEPKDKGPKEKEPKDKKIDTPVVLIPASPKAARMVEKEGRRTRFEGIQVQWMRFDHEGRSLLLAGAAAPNGNAAPNQRIAVHDIETGATRVVRDQPWSGIAPLVLPLPGGRVGVWSVGDKEIAVTDRTGDRAAPVPLPSLPPVTPDIGSVIAVSWDGRYVAAGRRGQFALPPGATERAYLPTPFRLLDTKTGKEVLAFDWQSESVHFNADSSRVLVIDAYARGRWFKLPGGEPDGEWKFGTQVTGHGPLSVSAASRDARVLLCHGTIGEQGGTFFVLDAETGRVVSTLGRNLEPFSPRLSADGRLAVAVLKSTRAREHELVALDTARGAEVARATLPESDAFGWTIALAPDGRTVVAAENRPPGRAIVYDLTGESTAGPPKTVGKLQVKERWAVDLGVDPPITRLASSLDGRLVVASGLNKIGSRCLDAATGELVPGSVNRTVTPRSGILPPRGVIALDGGRFAAPRFQGDAATPVWDPRKQQWDADLLKPIESVGKVSGSVFVSRDARYLAFGAGGAPEAVGPFKLRDVKADKTILELDLAHGQALFTEDCSRVLVADRAGKCRWFKLPSGKPDGEWTYQKQGTGLSGPLAISADGAAVLHEGQLAGRDELHHLLDGSDGRVIRSFPGTYVSQSQRGNSLSADARVVALIRREPGRNGAIDVIETATGAVAATLTAPADKEFLSLELLRDGSAVLAVVATKTDTPAETPQSVVRYDLVPEAVKPKDTLVTQPPVTYPNGPVEPGKLYPRWVAGVDVGRDAARIHADPEAAVVLVGNPVAGHAALDLKAGTPHAGFADLGRNGVADFFKLDGGRVGSVTQSMTEVRVWDAKTGKEEAAIDIPAIPPGSGNAKALRAVLSPNGKYLAVGRAGVAVADNPDVPLRVFDAAANKELVTTTWKGGSMHFTADSSRLLVAEWSGKCRWFKLPSGAPDGGWDFGPPPPGQRHLVYGISADGSAVAYKGPAGLKSNESWPGLVDGKTGEVTRRFSKHHFASDVSVSADGRRAALLLEVTADACTFDVVDTTTGASLGTARLVTGRAVPSFALSPDGNVLFAHDPAANKLHRLDVVPPKSP